MVGGGVGRHLHDHLEELRERVDRLPQPRFAVSGLVDDATLLAGWRLTSARDRALRRI